MKVRDSFSELFGVAPDLVTAAPGRVNLIGEHVDYNDGFVLPFAIDAKTYCALRVRSDNTIRIASAQRDYEIFEAPRSELKPLSGPTWTRYILGVIWSLGVEDGFEILVDSEVPAGAGLSSSAALECSVALAINDQLRLGKTLPELARITQRAENEFVGVPCGIMDQSISLMATAGHALLIDCRDLSTRQVRVDFEAAGLKLLIVDTRAHHALVDGGYAERRDQCEAVARQLGIRAPRDLSLDGLAQVEREIDPRHFRRARHVVSEIARVTEAIGALERDEFTAFGKLLSASHHSLRDDYNVSCPELDLVVETAMREGALGARMVGGGFGGSAIALIRTGDAGHIAAALEREFSESGFKAPRFFDSLPSQGGQILS